MLPFKAESDSNMRVRYQKAIREAYDIEAIHLGTQEGPGRQRRNTFDFEDGMRIVVTKEIDTVHRNPHTCIHVSASLVGSGCGLGKMLDRVADDAKKVTNRVKDVEEAIRDTFCGLVERRFLVISGDERRLAFMVMEIGGVPHWLILLKGTMPKMYVRTKEDFEFCAKASEFWDDDEY